MTKVQKFFACSLVLFLAVSFFSIINSAYAIEGLDTAASALGSNKIDNIPSAIGRVIGIALSFVGVAFFILMIYGGFVWMLARGNEQEVTKAKDLIQAAIIGLIIVLTAFILTIFIGNQLTNPATPLTPTS